MNSGALVGVWQAGARSAGRWVQLALAARAGRISAQAGERMTMVLGRSCQWGLTYPGIPKLLRV